MQKTRDGSILVWSLFLSFFIIFSFVSFSIWVNTAVKRNAVLGNDIRNDIAFNASIQGLSWTLDMQGWGQLVKDYSNNIALSQGKSYEVRCDLSTSPNITLSIKKGGPLVYKFLSFNTSTIVPTLTVSWVATTSVSFVGTLQGGDNAWILYIKNLWGYTDFSYTSSVECNNSVTTYKIMSEIWRKYFIRNDFEKKNFDFGDYFGFPYSTFELSF